MDSITSKDKLDSNKLSSNKLSFWEKLCFFYSILRMPSMQWFMVNRPLQMFSTWPTRLLIYWSIILTHDYMFVVLFHVNPIFGIFYPMLFVMDQIFFDYENFYILCNYLYLVENCFQYHIYNINKSKRERFCSSNIRNYKFLWHLNMPFMTFMTCFFEYINVELQSATWWAKLIR